MRAAELSGEESEVYVGRKFYVQLKGQHAEGKIRAITREETGVQLFLDDARWGVFGSPTKENQILKVTISKDENVLVCQNELQVCSRDERVHIEQDEGAVLPFRNSKTPLRAVSA